MQHDSLCPSSSNPVLCLCGFILKVRLDENQKLLSNLKAKMNSEKLPNKSHNQWVKHRWGNDVA